jgi:hypothetical protein
MVFEITVRFAAPTVNDMLSKRERTRKAGSFME